MRYGDPNRPAGPVDARPTRRHAGLDGTGSAAADGFTRIERRPLHRRGPMTEGYALHGVMGYGLNGYGPEMVPNEKASRIEGFFSDVPEYID